ncbi:MAG: BadF/BadG/BcrA/BcrD ATPase family protein [Bryobacter sp.]
MPRLFLGVDGGQSSTSALIADEDGRVLGQGRGGPCNHVKTGDGRAKFENAILGCVHAAAHQAGLDRDKLHFAGACLGFSGGPEDKDQLVRGMVSADNFLITNDGLIALTGATGGAPGIIVVAGTGSIAYGRNARGETARAGGWGYIYGDEGGGFDIARQAVRACLRQEEGWGPPTMLLPRMLEATGSGSANQMMHRFYTNEFTRPQIATYAQLVDEAARTGDRMAMDILNAAAQALAGFAASVRHVLFAETEVARVCPVGSVYQSEILHHRFATLVRFTGANEFTEPLFSPAAGALMEAWRLTGTSPKFDQLPQAGK